MKKAIIFWIVFLLQKSITFAQSDTIYFSDKYKSPCSKENADSYLKVRLADSSSNRYSCEYYSLKGTLKWRGFCRDNTFRHLTSTYAEYYENGKRKMTGAYLSDGKGIVNQQINTWYNWYENGFIQREKLFALDTATNLFNAFIVSFWDSAGVKKVIDGNGEYSFKEDYALNKDSVEEITFSGSIKYGLFEGIWQGFYSDGTLFCKETYNEKGLIEGKSYDRNGKEYTYVKVRTKPEFDGGDAGLMRFLEENIDYPIDEWVTHAIGKVTVWFTIDETGKVKDVKLSRSVSPGFDKKALQAVKMLPDFKPATFHGQPISVFLSQPIIFNLR